MVFQWIYDANSARCIRCIGQSATYQLQNKMIPRAMNTKRVSRTEDHKQRSMRQINFFGKSHDGDRSIYIIV